MTSAPPARTTLLTSLLENASLEMTGKDLPALHEAAGAIAPGSRVHVTFLAHEDLAARRTAAAAAAGMGLTPVPHVSARRLPSTTALDEFLGALAHDGTGSEVFVVGGDPTTPHGPFDDALAVLRSGLLARHDVRGVGFAGYPEGHPSIADSALWSALEEKAAVVTSQGLSGTIVTQFGFDAERVLTWLEEVRARGIDLPVRIGIPGPAGVRRLLRYATRFGVGTSAGIARKYGLSLTSLMGTAGPERFLDQLTAGLDPARHGPVGLHFYTFGGLDTTTHWIAEHRAAAA